MNQCKAIHYKNKTNKKTRKKYNVPNKQKNQLSFSTPICHYNGILLMAWSNKIIIIIKIMHRFK